MELARFQNSCKMKVPRLSHPGDVGFLLSQSLEDPLRPISLIQRLQVFRLFDPSDASTWATYTDLNIIYYRCVSYNKQEAVFSIFSKRFLESNQ